MIENGRKRILRGYRKDRSDWAVLLVTTIHEGYLSWPDYERNQRLIADNANGKGMMVRGAVLQGGSFARRPAALRPLRTQAARQLQRHEGRRRPL